MERGFTFKPFSEKQLKLLTFWQDDSPVSNKFMCIADGSIRSGKSQPNSSMVYTPYGKKPMGDIKVNDHVMGLDGQPTRVLGVYPQGKLDVYKITFSDGSTIRCSRNHLFSYYRWLHGKVNNSEFLVDSLDNIIKYTNFVNRRDHSKYRFPITNFVNFNDKYIRIDPFLLGYLLAAKFDLNKLVKKGKNYFPLKNILLNYAVERYSEPLLSSPYSMYTKPLITRKTIESHLIPRLKELGLCDDIGEIDKFIPDAYKYNNKEIRLRLLAGMLYVGGNTKLRTKNWVEFVTVNKQVMLDFIEVARSLGFYVRPNYPKQIYTPPRYSCSIGLTEELLSILPTRVTSVSRRSISKSPVFYRYIRSIEKVGQEECTCIYVDNEDHLYLSDDLVVSHNTVVCSLSFVLYVMTHFNHEAAAICGKTVMSVRRNVVTVLKEILATLGYEVVDRRSDNELIISNGDVENYFYLFGGKDESSQDLIQGMTLCSAFLDECQLSPLSFFQQVVARLSIKGSKVFTSSNPSSPYHWFYREYLQRIDKINGLYLHFTMDDNPSLDEEKKNQYKSFYRGVWAQRFIEGKWVVASGVIYDMFSSKNIIKKEDIPYEDAVSWFVSCDYGTGNATVFLLWMEDDDGNLYVCKEYYYAGRIEAEAADDYSLQKTDLEFSYDLRDFITDSYNVTGLTYREMVVVVDPSAASFITQLRKHHVRVKRARNEVLDGIRNTATLIANLKLKVCDKCVNLIKQTGTYQWDIKKQQHGIDAPLKIDDHAPDAMRYGVMYKIKKVDISKYAVHVGL